MADVFVASKEKPKNGYGQNGYQGPSSITDGKNVTSGFLPEVKLPDGVTGSVNENANWQTRNVSTEQYAPSHGMKARDDRLSFPTNNVRPVTKPVAAKGKSDGKSFQRR